MFSINLDGIEKTLINDKYCDEINATAEWIYYSTFEYIEYTSKYSFGIGPYTLCKMRPDGSDAQDLDAFNKAFRSLVKNPEEELATPSPEKTEEPVDSPETPYSIDNNMPDNNSAYSERGVYSDTENRTSYIIAMGTKSSGGYSISIEKVTINGNGNVEVIVKESTPSDGASSNWWDAVIVAQVITYPTCRLTLSKAPNSITVKNTNGEIFNENVLYFITNSN